MHAISNFLAAASLLAGAANALPSIKSLNSTSNSTYAVGKPVVLGGGVTVIGHAAAQKPDVSEYLGIPFAQPPLGNLRFKAPQKFTGSGTYNNQALPKNCPQNAVGVPGWMPPYTETFFEYLEQTGAGQNYTAFDEDCLRLNVWTKPQVGDAKKAVMVWFYGGGFRAGGTANFGIDGQFYADQQDVIIVTFNYRVDMFGFGNTGVDSNVGLLDQRMAIEWVRDNIAAFGGDPSRITLFGESAGAAGVDFYQYAYANDPIIHGSIMESGSTNLGNAQSNATAAALWARVVTAAGCANTTTSNDAQISCMRSLSVTDLLAASKSISGGGYAFAPFVDGKVVFQDYTSLLSQGAFIRKPIMTGSNEAEAEWFKFTSGFTQPEAYYTAVTLNLFTCVAQNLANIRRQFSIPSWRYHFYPIYPDTYHEYNSTLAMHTSELVQVWGTGNKSIPSTLMTADETTLSNTMMTLWATFAKNPLTGLTLAGWPLYNPNTASLAQFGSPSSPVEIAFEQNSVTDSACTPLQAYC